MTEKPGKSALGAFAPEPIVAADRQLLEAAQTQPADDQARALQTLFVWDAMAQGAYPPNTVRAWRADWRSFVEFCSAEKESPLPAVASYSTRVRSALYGRPEETGHDPAIPGHHRPSASRGGAIKSVRERTCAARAKGNEPAAARDANARRGRLGWAEIRQFLETAGKGIRADRERALLCVAYDTMARRSELVALDVEDLTLSPNGAGTALIRRSKTDQAGEGAQAYLSRETVRHLLHWLQAGNITEGAVFRRLVGRNQVGPRLHADMVADIFKRVGRWIKLPAGRGCP